MGALGAGQEAAWGLLRGDPSSVSAQDCGALQEAGLSVPNLGGSQADQNNWSPSLPAPGVTLSKPLALCPWEGDALGWGREIGAKRLRRSPALLEFGRRMTRGKAVILGEHWRGGQAHILTPSFPAMRPGQGAKSFHFLHCTMAREVTSRGYCEDDSVG